MPKLVWVLNIWRSHRLVAWHCLLELIIFLYGKDYVSFVKEKWIIFFCCLNHLLCCLSKQSLLTIFNLWCFISKVVSFSALWMERNRKNQSMNRKTIILGSRTETWSWSIENWLKRRGTPSGNFVLILRYPKSHINLNSIFTLKQLKFLKDYGIPLPLIFAGFYRFSTKFAVFKIAILIFTQFPGFILGENTFRE